MAGVATHLIKRRILGSMPISRPTFARRGRLQLHSYHNRHMVGWALPSASVAQNAHPLDGAGEFLADPNVVKAPSLVGLRPVGRAIAPPRVELLVIGHE